MGDKHLIELKNVSKTFDTTEALKNINLYIRDGEFLTLLGPSGCGKTTLLRLLAGFEMPTEGRIFMDGADMTDMPPHRRRLNTVFQRYALFEHLNVFDNVAFGLKIKKLDKDEIRQRVSSMLELVGLKGYDKRTASQLSGGQQQRVAIARALVNEPGVLLLDEPLGALDLQLRKDMQIELKKIRQRLGITFVFVTHDQEEALTMSDTIVVMKDGEIQQIGTPVDIYNEPKNAFVADFIGESNILSGTMLKDYSVRFSSRTFECLDAGFGENAKVDVVVRPEDIKVVERENGMIGGVVKSVLFMGVHYELLVDTGEFTYQVHTTAKYSEGQQVGFVILPDDIHIMRPSEP